MTKIERGSSPLTRGKPHRGVPDRAGTGLIPAHAGKTIGARESPITRWAHPRSRGENPVFLEIPGKGTGSSPLTRGKLSRCSRCVLLTGLIPAHAGKTQMRAKRFMTLWAHPRSRGENQSLSAAPYSTIGSSPLTRGKLFIYYYLFLIRGLIPAHAGKTCHFLPDRQPDGAHPRSRGENAHVYLSWIKNRGSSPLTRGKHLGLPNLTTHYRLIPAHAGKTGMVLA